MQSCRRPEWPGARTGCICLCSSGPPRTGGPRGCLLENTYIWRSCIWGGSSHIIQKTYFESSAMCQACGKEYIFLPQEAHCLGTGVITVRRWGSRAIIKGGNKAKGGCGRDGALETMDVGPLAERRRRCQGYRMNGSGVKMCSLAD